MKVLITGGRDWSDPGPIHAIIAGLMMQSASYATPTLLVLLHGGARGADEMAARWRGVDGIDVQEFKADWNRFKRAAGPIRNREMLDEEPDLVIAFHDDLAMSKGTLDCVEEARRRRIPVWHLRHVA